MWVQYVNIFDFFLQTIEPEANLETISFFFFFLWLRKQTGFSLIIALKGYTEGQEVSTQPVEGLSISSSYCVLG